MKTVFLKLLTIMGFFTLAFSCHPPTGDYTIIPVYATSLPAMPSIGTVTLESVVDANGLIVDPSLIDTTGATDIIRTNMAGGEYYQVTCAGDGNNCPENHRDRVIWLENYSYSNPIKPIGTIEQPSPAAIDAYSNLRIAIESNTEISALKQDLHLNIPVTTKAILINGLSQETIHSYISKNGDLLFYKGALRNPTFVYLMRNPRN